MRDGRVTGVQSCALPIFAILAAEGHARGLEHHSSIAPAPPRWQGPRCRRRFPARRRSEERRVGKEWRTRREEVHKIQKNFAGVNFPSRIILAACPGSPVL